MAQRDAIEQLRERFQSPLKEFESRRVVFWHDIDGSFEDRFDALDGGSLPSERQVRLLKLGETIVFWLKESYIDFIPMMISSFTRAPPRTSRRKPSKAIG